MNQGSTKLSEAHSMETAVVPVSSSLLLSRKLSPSAKVVWIALRLAGGRSTSRGKLPISPAVISVAQLASHAGLSRPTLRKALRELEEMGWLGARSRTAGFAESPGSRLRRVSLPGHLVSDAGLHPAAKVLYGILALMAQQTGAHGHHFRFDRLRQVTGWSLKRVRYAVRTLIETGWIEVKQAHRLAPVHYVLRDPLKAQSIAELERVKVRLGKARFLGEALMREYLSLLIECDVFEDDAAPGFLINPVTNERLQFDRFYPPHLAFEFNGPQHYTPSKEYPAEQVAWQRAKDFIKLGICSIRGIELCIVHAEDLSLETMRRKIGTRLPLRDLRHEGPRIAYLESVARAYRRVVKRGRHHFPQGSSPESN